MKAIKLLLLGPASVVIASLAGCGSTEPAPPPQQEPGALQRTIQEPLDKARAVEGQLQQQQQELQKTLNDAEG